MKIVVQVSTAARAELVRLLSGRVPDPADAVRFATLYVEDLVQQFRLHRGAPPEAERWDDGPRGFYWWRYVEGVWVLFRVTERPAGLLGQAIRTVTVLAFRERPPEPSAPRSTPRP